MAMPKWKLEWQRRKRRQFAARHGYSMAAYYGTGQLREQVLRRDNYRCVKCGMTDAEHRAKWGRPITIDHIDRNRSNNSLENLRTLCLSCHGRKDIPPELIRERVPEHKAAILEMRRMGQTYQAIAERLGFSPAAVWKWVKRWEEEEGLAACRQVIADT